MGAQEKGQGTATLAPSPMASTDTAMLQPFCRPSLLSRVHPKPNRAPWRHSSPCRSRTTRLGGNSPSPSPPRAPAPVSPAGCGPTGTACPARTWPCPGGTCSGTETTLTSGAIRHPGESSTSPAPSGMLLLKEQGPGDSVPVHVGTVEKRVEEGQEGVAGQQHVLHSRPRRGAEHRRVLGLGEMRGISDCPSPSPARHPPSRTPHSKSRIPPETFSFWELWLREKG